MKRSMLLPAALRPLAASAAAAAALSIGVGCNGQQAATDSAKAPAITVQAAPFAVDIEEMGVVEATKVASIVAPFSGKLISLIDTGVWVEAGDPIAEMEGTEYIDEINERLNELKLTKSDLEASIQQLTIAIRSNTLDVDLAQSELAYRTAQLADVNARLAQTESLYQRQVLPEEDVLDLESEAVSSRLTTITKDLDHKTQVTDRVSEESGNMLDIERHALRGARAKRRLSEIEDRVKSARITAPQEGFFIRKSVWKHHTRRSEESKAGDSVRTGQVLGEIPDLSSLVVRSQIPESELLRIRVGDRAEMTFDALGGLRGLGQVASISRNAIEREASAGGSLMEAESYSGQKVFEVTIALDESDSRLRPGLSAGVRILAGREETAVTAPVNAVLRRGDRYYVAMADSPPEEPEWREVELGPRNDESVVVISGLQAGDRILQTAPSGDSPVESPS